MTDKLDTYEFQVTVKVDASKLKAESLGAPPSVFLSQAMYLALQKMGVDAVSGFVVRCDGKR